MKKLVSVLVLALFLFSFTACVAGKDRVITSLGKYDDCVLYTEGEFQDYTDYGKYYYTSANIDKNDYFTKIEKSDLEKINKHLDDFENWIEKYKDEDASCEIAVNYDFDRAIIDTEDYVYIDSDKDTSLYNYDVYFFDTQTLVLYYFHNNI